MTLPHRRDRCAAHRSRSHHADACVCFDITAAHAGAMVEGLCMLDMNVVDWSKGSSNVIAHVDGPIVWRERKRLSSICGSRSFEASLHYTVVAAAAALKSGDRP